MHTEIRKPFVKRLVIYFRERFPFFTYLIFVTILFLSLNFISQILVNQSPFIDKQSVVGVLSAFLLMLLVRTFDDLKDKKLDDEIFPNRPISRGAVLISDVKILALFSFVMLLVINIVFAQETLLFFFLMMFYLLLTFKWFFAKKMHLKNPKLAMITHQPIPFTIIFYLILISLSSGNTYNLFTNNHFVVFLIFSLPITAWEVSRKIKSEEKENKYETFSKIFGIKVATLIPVVLYSITGFLSMQIAYVVGFHYSFFILILSYLIFLNYYFFRFLLQPVASNNNLQKVAMVFTMLLFLTLIVYLISNYTIYISF